ncbi:OLC1v1029251C1 [Oldenlandia corymbosa var. corymbosa]|uniref:OLC1v1029251C1 n=1 Tax=Oldenlandia corymbosa var. corymbosa TaxID=529605 RepID=A0AAV1CF12_OLDCO|nr:OLC1v1029251C1 [Oldenlandia corymbosa var. corymbosa]
MYEESVANAVPSIWASMNSWFTPAVLFVLLNVMIGTIAFTSTLANQKQHHNHQQQQGSQNDNPHQHQHHHHHQPNSLARSPSVLQRLKSINFQNYRFPQPSFVSASHFKTTPDSETHFNYEQTHQSPSLESHSQYIFEQPSHEKEAIFGQQVQEAQTQYYFDQIQVPKPLETETHFVFQQTHEENVQENGIGFDSEPAPEELPVEEDEPVDELQSLDEVYSKLTDRHVQRSNSDTKPVAGEIPARLPTKMKKSASMKSAFKHFEAEDIVEARRPATVKERASKASNVEDEEGVDAKADDFINKFKQQLKLQRIDSIMRYKEMINRGSERQQMVTPIKHNHLGVGSVSAQKWDLENEAILSCNERNRWWLAKT